MMKKLFLAAGAITCGVAVLTGAFAAHALKDFLSDNSLRIFHTGVEYQFYHSLALIITGIAWEKIKSPLLTLAGYLFLTGIILFSGSLYALSVDPSLYQIGFITPIGGLCFITGWLLLAIAFLRLK